MRSLVLLAAISAAFAADPVAAQENTIPSTRIEINEEEGAFIFIAKDKPIAILDKDGLHVRDGVIYGSALTDAGAESFEKKLTALEGKAADE